MSEPTNASPTVPPAAAPMAPPVLPASYMPPPRKSGFGLILLLVVIAFACGIFAALWGPATVQKWWKGEGSELTRPGPAGSAMPGTASVTSLPEAEARLAALATRLDELKLQAEHASSYASRAEAIMVAFAARRALDAGAPLGYLEGELRVRFGDDQPRAVATIISAAHEPVTLADLQAGLNEATPALVGNAPRLDWWTAAKREISTLIIVRKSSTPAISPQKALDRAKIMLTTGQVDAAIALVEKLPGHAIADGWLQLARRYNEAHRALDLVEAAAILQPRAMPAAPEVAPVAATADADNAAEQPRPMPPIKP